MSKKKLSKPLIFVLVIVLVAFCSFMAYILTTKSISSWEGQNAPVNKNVLQPIPNDNSSANNSKDNNNSTNNSTVTNDKTQNKNATSNKEATKESSANKKPQEHSFYGTWVIKSVQGKAAVTGLNEKEIKDIIGNKVTYSKNKAVYDQDVCENPYYDIQTEDKSDSPEDYRVSFKDLGIKSDSVKIVTVCSSDKNAWNSSAYNFWILNKNELLISIEGVYFKAVRA